MTAAITSPDNEVYVSAATAWEIGIKQARGNLRFDVEDFDRLANSLGILIIPISTDHAWADGALPRHHGDPFDRTLVAQARAERLTLVSVDPMMARYDVPLFYG